VSSDTSPPSHYRRQAPSLSVGEARADARGDAPRRPAPADPSWIKVIGTTLRLWLRRKVLHVPDHGRIGRSRRVVLAVVPIVVVAAAAGSAAVLTSSGTPAAAHHGRHAPSSPPTQAQIEAKANGQAAAAWFASQVSRQAVVGCDPVMCEYLLAAGFPGAQQYVLEPGVTLPGVATLVLTTAAVRTQYGASLTAAAPTVIASFGTGQESVQVRVIAPDGASAYVRAAQHAWAVRRAAGRALASDTSVHVHGTARFELTSGWVDMRLLIVLHRLAAGHAVYIVRFGDAGPGLPVGHSAPLLRVAVLGGLVAGHGRHQVSQLASVLRLLRRQPEPYHAELTVTDLAGGKVTVGIEFLVPSYG